MNSTTAKVLLANLRERIEIGTDGKFRLSGIITQKELDAIDFFIDDHDSTAEPPSLVAAPLAHAPAADKEGPIEPLDAEHPTSDVELEISQEPEPDITLNLSSLEMPDSGTDHRVCLDFGTAMSKATFVHDADDFEDIRVLKLGIPGDQEQIDENMLVSSVFIDVDGLLWFGQKAVEQSEAVAEGEHARMDNIKRALSEGNMDELLDTKFNPTRRHLTYEDIVLAYLSFFTWTINKALQVEESDVDAASNIRRRFAMPCFPRANTRLVESKLKVLLGEAQILADTFGHGIHQGLPLSHFLAALRQLRSEPRSYSFIEGSVTEPLGVAGSLLSWKTKHDSLTLVVDVGAGTSDFSLYRLHVADGPDGRIRAAAGEVDGTARGITEAGNHLDKILMAYILKCSGVNASHPRYINITHALERDIRHHKEELFTTGAVVVVLYTGDTVDIALADFMELEAVKAFEQSLRTTLANILADADREWIEWVRINPTRFLTIVLTGGGATLPMVKKLAEGTVTAHGITIRVAAAKSFPNWLQIDYPDLEEPYPRIAVSLGGARKNIIRPMSSPLTTTASGIGGHTLARFPISGS